MFVGTKYEANIAAFKVIIGNQFKNPIIIFRLIGQYEGSFLRTEKYITQVFGC
jgi:hypothetical protein